VAAGDDIFIPRIRADAAGNVNAQDLNDIFRQLFKRLYALEGRTEESTIRNNLTVQGTLSAEPFTLVSDKTVLSPPSIAADVTSYNPTGYGHFWRLTSDALVNINSIVPNPNVNGLELIIVNVGSNPILLKHNATSLYGILTTSQADLPLETYGMAYLWWDTTSAAWHAGQFPGPP
jgi:hypothetical protein